MNTYNEQIYYFLEILIQEKIETKNYWKRITSSMSNNFEDVISIRERYYSQFESRIIKETTETICIKKSI